MSLLLDTHALLWLLREPEKLPDDFVEITEREKQSFVSVASLWEIAIKVSMRKLALPRLYDDLFPSTILKSCFRILPVELPHLSEVASLPWHHKDPFDRLIIAQARSEGMTVLTRDKNFAAYDVKTVW